MSEEEVKELLAGLHKEEAGTMILEPQSVFNKGITGYKQEENKLIYSYDLLAEALTDSFLGEGEASCYEEAYTCAIDWLKYNTIRSAPYYEGYPIIEVMDNGEGE